MVCSGCGRSFAAYKGSRYCIGCAAGHTILDELQEAWASESLRRIADDISVSAARHIRALRLFSGRDLQAPAGSRAEEARAPAEPARPTAPRTLAQRDRTPLGRRPREERQRAASQPGPSSTRERDRRPLSRSPRRRESAPEGETRATTRPIPAEEAGEDYSGSYYYSEDEKLKPGRDQGEKDKAKGPLPGIAPKARPDREATSQPSEPLKLESKQEVHIKKVKKELETIAPVEIGSKEDRERSKQQYLDSLKVQQDERERALSPPQHRERRPSSAGDLKGGPLSLAGDYREKGDGERRRKRRR